VVPNVPDQPPDAVHEVALVEDQDKVELAPLETLVGLAVNKTLGAAGVTFTVADWAAVPPVPVQVSVYFVEVVRFPVV
jgi:hypothetical protein